MTYRAGIIGAGNMAEAIVRGLLGAKVFQPGEVIAADVSPSRRDVFSNDLKVTAVEDALEVARAGPEVILLSVKPQQMRAVLESIGSALSETSLVISIAAGIGSPFIEQAMGAGRRWRVIRAMPNTPMLVGQGMVVLSRGANATEKDAQTARRIFESAAKVVELPEALMDAVTAVSGSGPAYVFYLAEQMIAAGVALGLPTNAARLLAGQTILGAASMLRDSSDGPEELRRKVTSPGGTTYAAIDFLHRKAVGVSFVEAIKAAAARSKELGA